MFFSTVLTAFNFLLTNLYKFACLFVYPMVSVAAATGVTGIVETMSAITNKAATLWLNKRANNDCDIYEFLSVTIKYFTPEYYPIKEINQMLFVIFFESFIVSERYYFTLYLGDM